MISVYRIYLGHSWRTAGRTSDLLHLFDSLPEFLHTVTAVPDDGPDIAVADVAESRAATQVAMTHSHVAVLWGAPAGSELDWTRHEIEVARTGFRHRIPVLAIVPPGESSSRDPFPSALAVDRWVGWSGIEIARAIQDLAEEAAAVRRQEINAVSLREKAPPQAAVAPRRTAGADEPRALPVAEIAAAFLRYRAERSTKPQSGGSV